MIVSFRPKSILDFIIKMTHNEYMYDDELDPEIAALLDTVEHNPRDLQDLSVGTTVSLDEEDEKVGNSRTNSISDVDLSIRAFKPITEFFSSTPHFQYTSDFPAACARRVTGNEPRSPNRPILVSMVNVTVTSLFS